MRKLYASYRRVPNELASKKPLLVGAALTKVFLAIVVTLAILPQHTADGWQIRIWAFLLSPSNVIGDTFAGIAGVLAFLWIIITVWLQSEELSDQRKVLIEQRDEFSIQNENMRRQIFDNTFFQMLTTLGEIIDAIDLHSQQYGTTKGRDCFKIYYERLLSKYQRNQKTSQAQKKPFDEINSDFFKQHGHEFGHYFRFLYNFFRFISNSDETQDYHIKVLRAYLSDYELALMFYNCLTTDGENFKTYISRYSLFDNLPLQVLIDKKHVEFYEEASFGENTEYKLYTGRK